MIIFIPNAKPILATVVPIRPAPPTNPRVLSLISCRGSVNGPVKFDRSFWHFSMCCCCIILLLKFSTYVMAICATASVEYVGMLQTAILRSRASIMGKLLYPVPASHSSFTDFGNCNSVDAGNGISLVMTISTSFSNKFNTVDTSSTRSASCNTTSMSSCHLVKSN